MSLEAQARWLREVVRIPGRDMSLRQLAVLMHGRVNPETWSIVEMAKAFDVPPPAITRAVEFLVQEKLVARQHNDDDRRRVVLALTLLGNRHLDDLAELAESAATQ